MVMFNLFHILCGCLCLLCVWTMQMFDNFLTRSRIRFHCWSAHSNRCEQLKNKRNCPQWPCPGRQWRSLAGKPSVSANPLVWRAYFEHSIVSNDTSHGEEKHRNHNCKHLNCSPDSRLWTIASRVIKALRKWGGVGFKAGSSDTWVFSSHCSFTCDWNLTRPCLSLIAPISIEPKHLKKTASLNRLRCHISLGKLT